MSERDINENTRSFWEANAANHKRHAYNYEDGGDTRYPFYETRRDRVLELLAGGPAGRLLDAGCGAGQLMVDAAAAGWDVYGIDLSRNMIELAHENLGAANLPQERAAVGNLGDLTEFDDGYFDAVMSVGVLEYIPVETEKKIYGEIRRVLKPRGNFYCENINGLFDLATFNRFTANFFRDAVLPNFFDDDREMDDIQEKIGKLLTHPQKPDTSGKYSTTRDQVFTKAENPLIFHEKAAAHGFTQTDLVFYRFHAVPPLLFEKNPEYEALTIEREKEMSRHWTGHFLASGFISVLQRTD
jgi:SAM-dependent methyltransferase